MAVSGAPRASLLLLSTKLLSGTSWRAVPGLAVPGSKVEQNGLKMGEILTGESSASRSRANNSIINNYNDGFRENIYILDKNLCILEPVSSCYLLNRYIDAPLYTRKTFAKNLNAKLLFSFFYFFGFLNPVNKLRALAVFIFSQSIFGKLKNQIICRCQPLFITSQ